MRHKKEPYSPRLPLNPELIWLAGLLEGEGCFLWTGNTPVVKVAMTDEDVMLRASKALGCNLTGPYPSKKKPGGGFYKPIYYAGISGRPAFAIMKKLLPIMGNRRTKKIRSILKFRAQHLTVKEAMKIMGRNKNGTMRGKP